MNATLQAAFDSSLATGQVAFLVQEYVDRVQAVSNSYYAESLGNLTPATFEVENRRGRFYRIARHAQGQTSVHCFINKTTGEIHFASGWNRPGPVRFNLMDEASRERLLVLVDEGHGGTGYLYAGALTQAEREAKK